MADARFEHSIEIVTPEGVGLSLPIAGIGSRFAARLLDSLIQSLTLLVVLILGALFGTSLDSGLAVVGIVSAVFIVLFLYDAIFEILLNGQTPGKRATGIRVMDVSGSPASRGALLVRNLIRIVDFLPMYYMIGFVSMLATEHTQRVGDLVANTLVIRERTGQDASTSARKIGAKTSVPTEQVMLWDVSAVTQEELELCYQFLGRRLSLPSSIRYNTAIQIASRLATKVAGLPATSHPEYVIEGVVVAKEARS